MNHSEPVLQLLKRYDFNQDVLDSIIGGRSLIDVQNGLTGFTIENGDDANRFLVAYGFDPDDPIESAEMLGYFHESLNFIRKWFLKPENEDGIKLEIPRKILEISDVRDLVLMAAMKYPGQTNDTNGMLLRNWGCSLLKVMHTVSFIDKDIRSHYFKDIQTQIFDRFYKMVQRDEAGNLFLGKSIEDPMRIELVEFESKPRKSRESVLLKLLHKEENVAEDIFDTVGIRFTTRDRISALRVVKFLKDEMIIMPGNIKPSRSKNNLIDVESLLNKIEQWKEVNTQEEIVDAEFRRYLEDSLPYSKAEHTNKHSAESYRSIQFTCRQLIKLTNPLYDNLKDIIGYSKEMTIDRKLERLLKRIDLKALKREVRFFYPFEVQVFDEQSAKDSREGASSHVEYKKAQIQTAMNRVLGNFTNGNRL